MVPKVLVVLTSKDIMSKTPKNQLSEAEQKNPEFARPFYALTGKDAKGDKLQPPRVEITVTSPKGAEAPIDQASVDKFKDEESVRFYKTEKALWKETKPLENFVGRASEFDAIFFPGGHGPMFDLVDDENSQKLIAEFFSAGKTIAAVCHGPIVLANVKTDGKPIIQGCQVTGFSNEEEEIIGLTQAMPQLLEDEVKRNGGHYVKADKPWAEKVVIDGNLITGQNPASAGAIGRALAEALGKWLLL
ncbi:class I glutamine amidotransferase-like protein [Dactylonectria macrodidyma]|uniref:D-lactate dehydratase n=1 Tax=Dactylonectria macrodidyma TaxID=307937 RepID=A0A9P9IKV9_9HYPO|nr:class I glutamine amidotransferase-like protein [Dactylonectria macrodidyma]